MYGRGGCVCPAGGAIDDNIVLTIRNVKKARRDPAGETSENQHLVIRRRLFSPFRDAYINFLFSSLTFVQPTVRQTHQNKDHEKEKKGGEEMRSRYIGDSTNIYR